MRIFLQKFLLSVVASLISIVFCLVIIEVGFRFYGKIYNIDLRLYLKELTNSDRLPSELFDHQNRPYALLKPNVQVLATTSDFSVIYTANDIGIRDKDYSLEKEEGKIRVLLFGDSFTFGEGVPDGKRFADILEDKIPNLEVINFGMPGYGIDTELILYEQVARVYMADYVVVAANWLDAERNYSNIYHNGVVDLGSAQTLGTGVSGSTAVISHDDERLKQRLPFSAHSYFISYLNYQFMRRSIAESMAENDEKLWDSIRLYVDHKPDLEEAAFTIQKMTAILQMFSQFAERDGAEFIIINIDAENPLAFIPEILPEHKYFNYQPQLAEYSKSNPLRFTYDFHFNSDTHQQIGNWLVKDFEQVIAERDQNHF
ncbi:MAG: hypothetical protein COU63_01910 [Candidatus Pacebacteria bacterium CG10_big_fil_rev_8_21_14_0_10_36_11]|nr:SGNH/GDSL hydrolase family protein [Candidatus Pacearchaeota archaeon]OIP73665.1 MAG: hypothetical protein AUK08_03815 [Candidatus Pacebacteria bacterium CG2_30_36_39]PIR64753.1 MAG: hypothetical protein COU63_01910 [Candidatus Pacebacteria bacterium CG10_big_fil_rev_8_21_14_0_10_36_11]PJC43055.1 MAG: hypothetical protein CO040_01180 [Candidatus Pacebacteria bacterium CG_4_9_14_0_2_um_filter_36_8]